jgi:hypothetical protein
MLTCIGKKESEAVEARQICRAEAGQSNPDGLGDWLKVLAAGVHIIFIWKSHGVTS